jgi:hypothetical protein
MTEKDYWNSLEQFKVPLDVPRLPKPLTDFHKRRLKELGAFTKDQLVRDEWYVGRFRVTDVAQWKGDRFLYVAESFNHKYVDYCNHFEDDDGYALFVPLRFATPSEIPSEIPTPPKKDTSDGK